MSNSLQKLTLSLLPQGMAEAAERESKKWVARCRCGHERSIWELGGVRYLARGRPRRLLKCPRCQQLAWHEITYRDPGERPIEAGLAAPSAESTKTAAKSFIAVLFGAALTVLTLVSALLSMMGAVFVMIAISFLLTVSSYTSSGHRATGTVVDFDYGRGYRPVVLYMVDDQEYRVRGRIAMTPSRYHPGESVRVYYDPAQPSDARIDDWIERGGPFACVGSILGMVGTGGLLVGWWRLRRRGRAGN